MNDIDNAHKRLKFMQNQLAKLDGVYLKNAQKEIEHLEAWIRDNGGDDGRSESS